MQLTNVRQNEIPSPSQTQTQTKQKKMPNHDSKPAASYPSINSQLPFTYVRPATLLVPEEFQTGRKMEWSQTRLCDALSLSRATFETLLKHLDSYFTSGPQNPQATGLTWINLNGDDDPRADVCRELGMIDFGFALVQKVLGLKGRRDAEGGEINTIGYLLYQVAMASEKRTLARSLRQRKAIAAQISEDRKMAERMQAEREKEVREEAPAEEADGEKEVREETPAKAEGEMNVQALAEMEINAQNTFAGAAVRDNQMVCFPPQFLGHI